MCKSNGFASNTQTITPNLLVFYIFPNELSSKNNFRKFVTTLFCRHLSHFFQKILHISRKRRNFAPHLEKEA